MVELVRLKLGTGLHYATRADRGDYSLLDRAPWLGGTATGESVSVDPANLCCPLEPSKILGIGRNYRSHAQELGHAPADVEPLVFSKPPSSLIGPQDVVTLPKQSLRVDYEAELGVVIGKRTRHVETKDVLSTCVYGFTIVCDVTARDLQKKDDQWTRAKGFDTFCPVGPGIVSDVNPHELRIQLRVNDELKQDGNTKDMLFNVEQLVAHISTFMTLEPGDLIATGTPAGVGPLRHGDQVSISIDAIGLLEFSVRNDVDT